MSGISDNEPGTTGDAKVTNASIAAMNVDLPPTSDTFQHQTSSPVALCACCDPPQRISPPDQTTATSLPPQYTPAINLQTSTSAPLIGFGAYTPSPPSLSGQESVSRYGKIAPSGGTGNGATPNPNAGPPPYIPLWSSSAQPGPLGT